MARKKRRGKRKKSRGRGWITLLMILLIGFFGLSIYLGRKAESNRRLPARSASLELPPPIVPDPGSPNLVVWNGCGRPGVGRRATKWLRRQGFNVFDTGNADRKDYRQTLVVARSHRIEAAKAVADRLRGRLGIGLQITQQVDLPEADVLLILGNDFPDSLPIY